MLKLNASYSKKVPASEKYSSESYLACIEAELPTGVSPQELQEKIHDTFELVKRSVEAEIAGQAARDQGRGPQDRQEQRQGHSQPYIPASNKQIKYLLDLGKAKDLTLAALNTEASRLYGVDSIYNLSKPDASRFVDHLKSAA